ncbi:MAG: discoidin domain-containing protein [Verrucomicrobiales bacterium]|nr:discoidin domain-containing protein [Verrucomicrobiales bacterium]
MKRAFFPALLACLSLIGVSLLVAQEKKETTTPLKVLLVAGGCCHDYAAQHKILFEGIQARANVRVDVWWTDDKTVEPPLTIYDKDNWAEGYDLVIHDECAAGNKDLKVMKRILDAHQTIPAVHLHCAMHSFRNDTDQWFKHLGIQSSRHGPKKPIDIDFVDGEHPITKGLENWTTGDEELYNNVDVFDAHPLAMGTQKYEKGGEEVTDVAIVAWTNETQGAPSFSTTLGHNNFTVEDDRYLNLVTRGLLWAAGKLNDDYLGKAYTGENEITFLKGKEKPVKPKVKKKAASASPEKNATLVAASASSEESSKKNFAWKAVDGDRHTRWCASNSSKPQWLQIDLPKPGDLTGATIIWESANNAYHHRIEGSKDGKSWTLLANETGNKTPGDTSSEFSAKGIRSVRITCTGTDKGGWASIREVVLNGPGLTALFPKLDGKQAAEKQKSDKAANDPYAKEGNVPPKIVKLSAEEEAALLADVKVPEGFEVSLFSNSAAANYPVYVTAAPNGDLYVSSDGNGSLGRDPHRGRVLRLRDEDGDGRADEVTEFVKDVDSPRGAIWDHDRLILLHPPHITAYIDKDGDGVAEESKRLIDNIAFGFADRPADHTTNALEMGIDGWIYIAGGDFGFLEATGSDGRKLQHRNGGVIRFRPDGSGLEIYATGTRNILGTPTSPLLDMFARDNTNDGGGWDVRFHNFTGLEEHGYPRLYKNFPDEHIKPLADYGGGSGCGSVYIHEPGFPDEWKNAPFTCDWGTGALWKHTVQRSGASFEEVTDPMPFIRMTRPTDADVDGNSAVYQASWIGASFKWAGPDVGYIARVTPKGYEPEPMPDFENMSAHDLVSALDSPSHIRTLTAQRALLRKEMTSPANQAIFDFILNSEKPIKARVAALFAASQRVGDYYSLAEYITPLFDEAEKDLDVAPYIARSIGDHSMPEEKGDREVVIEFLQYGLESKSPQFVLESIIAATRLDITGLAPAIASHLDSTDPRVAHTTFQALARLNAANAAFDALSVESTSQGAAFALMRMHDPKVVDRLISVADSAKESFVRQNALSALCRLYHTDGKWDGASWGTRPDTRGPYYQPEPWSETEKISASLKAQLDKATPKEATFLVQEMSRNRIQSNDALERVLTLSQEDPTMIPEAVKQLAAAEEIPADGISVLLEALKSGSTNHLTLSNAVTALSKTDSKDAVPLSLAALATMESNLVDLQAAVKKAGENPNPNKAKSDAKYAKQTLGDAQKQLEAASKAFLGAPKLENHHLVIEELSAGDFKERKTLWANAALLSLASRKGGSPESREMTAKTMEKGWQNPDHRVVLIEAAAAIKNRSLDDRIRIAMKDTNPAVASAAKAAAKTLKIQAAGADKTPKIATLSPDAALQQVIAHKGNAALGEAVYARATCTACHTVSQDEAQKGPYLGNIAETYKRPELATAIIDPNKTIAQGFKTVVITLKDGGIGMGFVTDEQGEQVTIRDIAAQEHTYQKNNIAKREELPTSMMPPGLMMNFTVHEMASLLDYLELIAKKK